MICVLDNTLTVPPSSMKVVASILAGEGRPWSGSFVGIDADYIVRLTSACLDADPFDDQQLRENLHVMGCRGFIAFASCDSDITLLWGYRFTDSGVSMMIGSLKWSEVPDRAKSK